MSEVKECDISSFVLFYQDCLGCLASFWFHINFRIICSSSVKTDSEYFSGDCIKSVAALGGVDILTVLILPLHEHGIAFHFFVISSSVSFSVLWFSEYRSFLLSFLILN